MKLNKEDTEKLLEQIANSFDELKQLFIDKNKDYGCSIFTTEPLCPSMCPMTAIRVRINDKINRLSNLFNTDEVFRVKESIADTLNDLAVYSIILANLYKFNETKHAPNIKEEVHKIFKTHTDCPSLMDAKDLEDKIKAEIASEIVHKCQWDLVMKDYKPKENKDMEDIKISDGIVEKYNS